MTDRKRQARPAHTRFLTAEDFLDHGDTKAYWLTSAGIMVNSRGTILLIDPVLASMGTAPIVSEMFRQLLIPTPIQPNRLPKCDAVLYTHMDGDHLSEPTVQQLQWTVSPDFYTPSDFVNERMRFFGIMPSKRHVFHCGETIRIGCVEITRTPARHTWQEMMPDHYDWRYQPEDCTGYLLKTPDGNLWITGDTTLLPEHLAMQDVDMMFLDYSKSSSHFGFDNAVMLSNKLEKAALVMYHWGTFDEPEQAEFNADPAEVRPHIIHPERFYAPNPGEGIVLKKKYERK